VLFRSTGNGTQGLYYAWEGIVRENRDSAQVNLLDIFEALRESTDNAFLREVLYSVQESVEMGRSLATAFSLPVEDCKSMVGKDGGIAEGDAHLTNYRENANFFLDPMNPSNFEVTWTRASTIYKSLGVIDVEVPAAKVKAALDLRYALLAPGK
jgi:hypothetical protein